MKTIAAFILGILAVPLAAYLYFALGVPPVAAGDKPFPMEAQIVQVPLDARIKRESRDTVPIEASAGNLTAGAHIYREQCASCHGLQGHPSQFAETMFPGAPQLWERHHGGAVVGVSDDPPGETYWKVKNGIRLSGMPAYKSLLNDTQMWQVSLLLSQADKPLPAEATATLSKEFSY